MYVRSSLKQLPFQMKYFPTKLPVFLQNFEFLCNLVESVIVTLLLAFVLFCLELPCLDDSIFLTSSKRFLFTGGSFGLDSSKFFSLCVVVVLDGKCLDTFLLQLFFFFMLVLSFLQFVRLEL